MSGSSSRAIADSHGHVHDPTAKVNQIVKNSGIKTGMAHVFNIIPTAQQACWSGRAESSPLSLELVARR